MCDDANGGREALDVAVVLNAEWAGRNCDAVALLERAGLEDAELDDAEGVVEGTLPADRLDDLKQLPCVATVRIVFAYIAEQGPASAEE